MTQSPLKSLYELFFCRSYNNTANSFHIFSLNDADTLIGTTYDIYDDAVLYKKAKHHAEVDVVVP